MQTVLGSNGQIGQEIVKALYQNYTKDLRLVSRHPKKIHETDQLVSADLTRAEETNQAIKGSEIVYFAVGLPMNTALWEAQFPTVVKNVIEACIENNSKLVFFDNTYMYAKNSDVQTENSPFVPKGRKSVIRANIAEMVQDKMNSGELQAVICRAPEFYGPAKTQGITNTMVFDRVKAGQAAKIPINDRTLRSLIWTPDASKATALIGNTPDAYGQVWHLPCAEGVSYQDIIKVTEQVTNQTVKFSVIKMWQFRLGSLFNPKIKELMELLPRYKYDNNFNSDKFKAKFPDFKITSFEEGVSKIFEK